MIDSIIRGCSATSVAFPNALGYYSSICCFLLGCLDVHQAYLFTEMTIIPSIFWVSQKISVFKFFLQAFTGEYYGNLTGRQPDAYVY
jgi:hypothetical protein